jgi:hypothetical protein
VATENLLSMLLNMQACTSRFCFISWNKSLLSLSH